MKKIEKLLVATIITSFIGLTSCMSPKYYMSDEEIAEKGYSIEGWNILKNGEKVGVLTTTEWELYKNSLVHEISIKTSYSSDEEMKEIARFVHSKFPNSKIEVNEDDGNSFPKE